MLDEMEDPYSDYDRLEISASILNEGVKFEHLQQVCFMELCIEIEIIIYFIYLFIYCLIY